MLRLTTILAFTLLSLLTLAALITVNRVLESQPPRTPADSPVAAREAGGAGLRVVMDRATGTIVRQPTREQLGRLGPESPFVLRRKAEELRRFPIPAGGKGVALEGWGQHALQVRRVGDGSLRVVCSQGDEHGSGR